jgi:type I restriction enzyme, S subunit
MIPDGWKVETLGEVSDIKTGGTPNRSVDHYWNGEIPWMSSGEIHQKYVTHTAEYITNQGLENSNARILPKGAVMIALNGQGKTRGKTAILEKPVTCNQSLAAIITNEQYLYPYFLLNYLDNEYTALRNLTGDDARNGLNLSLLRSVEILLPPLPEQKRIAGVLSGVDAAIEGTKAVIAQTRKIKQGLLQTLLTRGIGHTKFKNSPLGEIPESWEVVKFGSVIKSSEGGVSVNSEDRNKQISESGILKTSCVQGGKFYPLQHKTILDKELERAKTKPISGCIIFSRMNTPALVGESGYVEQDYDDLYLPDRLWLLSVDTAKVSSLWLSNVMTSKDFRRTLSEIATGTSGSMKNISKPKLQSIDIALPPLSEQKTIAKIFDSIDGQINTETVKLASLQQLKKGMMHDLLTGKVRVPVGNQGLQLVQNQKQPKNTVDDFCLTAPVEPLYKHALLRAEIASQFHNHTTFGAVKLEKLVDLATRHNGLDDLLDRTAYRDAAGPYDGHSRHKIDDIFQKEKWFLVHNQGKGKQVKYAPAEKFGGHKQDYQTYLGHYDVGIQSIVALLRDEDKDYCERVATLYAAWNDFLLDGKNPADAEIINDAIAWHSSKSRFSRNDWQKNLNWMRRKNLVPTGRGRKTKVSAS